MTYIQGTRKTCLIASVLIAIYIYDSLKIYEASTSLFKRRLFSEIIYRQYWDFFLKSPLLSITVYH